MVTKQSILQRGISIIRYRRIVCRTYQAGLFALWKANVTAKKLTRRCYAEGFYAQPKFSPAKNPHWMVTLERIAPADTLFLPLESHLLDPKDNSGRETIMEQRHPQKARRSDRAGDAQASSSHPQDATELRMTLP